MCNDTDYQSVVFLSLKGRIPRHRHDILARILARMSVRCRCRCHGMRPLVANRTSNEEHWGSYPILPFRGFIIGVNTGNKFIPLSVKKFILGTLLVR